MSERVTGRESDKFMLRLPDGMRERLKAEAEANNRSMNAEIIARLQDTFDAAEREAEARARGEEAVLRAQYDSIQNESRHLHERMASMAEQLARIEFHMAERGVKPKDANQ